MFSFGWAWSIAGVLLLLLGGYMVLFFPFTRYHQGEHFQVSGPLFGLLFLVIGWYLVFW